MATQRLIGWTRALLERFKLKVAEVEAAGGNHFTFTDDEGVPHEFLLAYAKYLIEYLEDRLPKP